MKDRWVILGKPECRWCKEAMQLLHEHHKEFTYMDVVGNELSEFLINCGLTSVPQIYHNGYHLGGFDELQRYLDALSDISPVSDMGSSDVREVTDHEAYGAMMYSGMRAKD